MQTESNVTQAINAQNADNPNYHVVGKENLWLIEQYLKNYNKNIIKVLSNKIVVKDNALDFGAGIGTLAAIWTEIYKSPPECVEIDPEYQNDLSQRGYIVYKNLKEINKTYSLIYTSNVLEHIENDTEILNDLNKLLNKDGHLCIYVPAFQSLYSAIDRSVGHFRRYDRAELIQKVQNAGFNVLSCEYSDSVGFLTWLFVKYQKKQEDSISKTQLAIYDKFIFPISKALDLIGLKYFFGKNLVLIAQPKTATGDDKTAHL